MYQDPSQNGEMQPQNMSAGAGQTEYRSIWNQQGASQVGGYANLQQGAGLYGQQGYPGYGQQPAAQSWQNPVTPTPGAQSGFAQQGVSGPQGVWPQADAGQPYQPWPGQAGQPAQGAWPQMPVSGGQPVQDPGMRQMPQMPPQNWQEAQLYNGPMQNPNRPFPWRILFIVLICGVLPLLFIVTMLLGGTAKTVFTVLLSAAVIGTLIPMWLIRPFEKPTHIMITVLCALALVVAVILGMRGAAPDRASAQTTSSPAPSAPLDGYGVQEAAPQAEEEPEQTVSEKAAEESEQRLRDFLDHWKDNNLDYMVNLCAPSWLRSIRSGDAKSSLFGILQNRALLAYEIQGKTGTENDQLRKITIMALIDRHTTVDSQRQYQIDISVVRENDTWYVDPASITSYEPTPAPTSTSSKPTQPPTPAPASQSTVLYYNPDGGKFYHADPNCPTVSDKYKPLRGTFYYSQINEGSFRNLQPCSSCAAPNRP